MHYHKRHDGDLPGAGGGGTSELDGERMPVRPMTAVFIKPMCRHRAVGRMTIINVPIPAFDEGDEFED